MNNFNPVQLNKIADFNPSESLPVGNIAKKVPMNMLKEFQRKISGYELAEYKSGPKFRNNDTLVAKITPCLENGKTAYVDILSDGEVAFGSSEYIVLRAKEKTFPEFLYYLAISPAFRARAISCMEGTSGRKRVNEGVLKLYELPIPCFEKQIKIANVLSALDKKIELNNRINTELEAMAKTLYDYWFVQFDFPISKEQAATMGKPELEGKPYKTSGGKMVYNPTLKREIPEGWEARNVLSIADLLGGGTPTKTKPEYWNGTIPFFTPSDSDKNIFSVATEDYITDEGLKKSSTRLFERHTVFITARGSVGRLALNAVPMAMNQSCYALKAREGVSYTFLFFLTKELIHHLEVKASGSVFNSIVSNDIEFTNLALPKERLLIDKFAAIAEPAFEKIEAATKESKQLSALRDWLLPMLMNGQVTVS
ncbi:restriction endonuclease subunit S [Oceanospirillum linum]|uniref:Type I restriction modification DNA specificity domain-containing protein n=1 Tax=Oceanospirillum linum TaxID=966 RepID=A0A1T1H8M3_OCELI|nr:restriction endonuclease subunit S [Oceanospirillum linum]OOV86155.1 hypothetical protein BTA35_0214325 [Oceanospirillum linum]SEG39179.1 type I restriction enzyme, S subunit [Oleiphilus messinensis]SMP31664.1 type I restriction enzyme, S subunit [Oceanospirillum linum]